MKRASSQSGAGSSAPAAKRPRTDPPLNAAPPAPGAQISRALEAGKTSTSQVLEACTESTGAQPGAPVDPGALAAFLDALHAARRDYQTLEKELQAFGQDLVAEVTVLNINAAMLLEKKKFLLEDVEGCPIPPPGLSDWSEVGGVLGAIWERVDLLVKQCKYEEEHAAASAEEGGPPVLSADMRERFQKDWWAFLKRAWEYVGPDWIARLPDWIAREWTGVAGTDGEQSSVSLELLPATKGVYRLAACDINGGGKIIAILVADRSEVEKIEDLLLPASSFLSRAAFNVVFAVRMNGQGHWHKVYAGDLNAGGSHTGALGTSHTVYAGSPFGPRVYQWLSTFPGQEQYDGQRKKDMAATHERFPGAELSEVREKILNERDRHRLAWKLSPGNDKPEAHALSSILDDKTWASGLSLPAHVFSSHQEGAERIDDLLKLLQSVEKATTSDPAGSTTGAAYRHRSTGWKHDLSLPFFQNRVVAPAPLFLRSEKQAKAREDARAAFLQRLEKNTNPEAGLAPLVKSRLNEEARGNIMLVPDGGDPASAEPCIPEDRLLDLLTHKNADGSARGGWKWLGPGRVEMQFYAMIQ